MKSVKAKGAKAARRSQRRDVPTIASLVKDEASIGGHIRALSTTVRASVLASVNQELSHTDQQRSALGAIMVCSCHGHSEADAVAMFKQAEAISRSSGRPTLNRTFVQYRSNILSAYKCGIRIDDFVTETKLRAAVRTARTTKHNEKHIERVACFDTNDVSSESLARMEKSNALAFDDFQGWYELLPQTLRADFWQAIAPVMSQTDKEMAAMMTSIEGAPKRWHEVARANEEAA